MCQNCFLENETTEHYILRCPTFTVQRMLYLQGLTNILDLNYIANLSDDDIVQLFLHGDLALSNTTLICFQWHRPISLTQVGFSFRGQLR